MAFADRGIGKVGHVFQFVETAVFAKDDCFHYISP